MVKKIVLGRIAICFTIFTVISIFLGWKEIASVSGIIVIGLVFYMVESKQLE